MDKPGHAEFQSRGRRLLREFSVQGDFGRTGMDAPHNTNRHNRISAYAFNLAGGLGSGSYWQGSMETPKDTISAGSWVHIVARYDMAGNTIRIYRNSVKKDEDALNESEYNVVQENGTASRSAGAFRASGIVSAGAGGYIQIHFPAAGAERAGALYSLDERIPCPHPLIRQKANSQKRIRFRRKCY